MDLVAEIGVADLDDARAAWRAGDRAGIFCGSPSGMTLGACLEAACWAALGGNEERTAIERWGAAIPTLRNAVVLLTTNANLPRLGDHDAPALELRRCPSRVELADPMEGVEWRYFLDRFRRSLTTTLALSTGRARGLAGVMQEMVDNVVEHAGLGDVPTGVVAYQVSGRHFAFAVADLGRGVLTSLRDNPVHAAIASDSDALHAAVTAGASRRSGPDGRGFADLLRVLADMEGDLVFRSGSARLRLDGRGTGSRVVRSCNSPEMCGFQLSVHAEPARACW